MNGNAGMAAAEQQQPQPIQLVPVYGYPMGMPPGMLAYPMAPAMPMPGGALGGAYVRYPIAPMAPPAGGLAHPGFVGVPNGRLYAQPHPPAAHLQYQNHHQQASPRGAMPPSSCAPCSSHPFSQPVLLVRACMGGAGDR